MSKAPQFDLMNMMEVVMPTAPHQHTFIFLHGRGSTAKEFSSEIFESQASDDGTLPEIFPHMKWVFPTAPIIPAARFDNQPMSQWFDMYTTENPHEHQEEQVPRLEQSTHGIRQIIDAEAKLIGHENLFIGGISQGSAVAVAALAAHPTSLAGFLGLSSWHPPMQKNDPISSKDTPIFLEHCADDEVIQIKYGKHLRDTLLADFSSVSWREYDDGGHWLNEPKGVDDAVEFITTRFTSPKGS